MTIELIEGDSREVLRELEPNSIDSIVTDPPYGLEFMGKEWDSADGFRRALNPSDAGRDNAFGRTSAKAPEYKTTGRGKRSAPGIGERPTEWVSNQGWNQYRCAACGHLFHGGSPCVCEEPKPVKADNRWNVFQEWCGTWAVECLRVLKPGGHLLAFGGTRTYHRLACAIEDAGFEIRDQIGWLYGSGFPKSHNQHDEWEGWGTALKPAWEPIVVARKPLAGTVAQNLARWGVGALNIDGCRVGWPDGKAPQIGTPEWGGPNKKSTAVPGQDGDTVERVGPSELGRWPANIVHDGSDEVLAAFPDAKGQQGDVRGTERSHTGGEGTVAYGEYGRVPFAKRSDGGSAARFFYCAKASKKDRDDGLTTPEKPVVTFATANGTSGKPSSISEGRNTTRRNTHPTVKPTELMRYLCRLVTPPGGTVLDPFMGSGSTGRGAVLEGFSFIGIEMEREYFDIADARIAAVEQPKQAAAE